MDFGLVDSLVCSSSATSASNNGSSLFSLDNNDTNNKQRCYGFEFLKQGRATNVNEDGFRDFNKVTKISSLQRSDDCNLTDGHQQMLSFSSPSSQAMTWPYYHQTSSGFVRNTGGYGSSGINAANMQQGILSGGKGPFTPSQWMELEHQALIYKYITSNVPVPSYLLNPIRKAFDSVGFSSFPGLRSNALGWGGFHLGFASNDPEPGRCRRTDGKKWRCSRDAVVDQKYCERHMNRGRHRSRKPVEGQSGHSASGATTTTTGGKTVMSTASNTSMSMVAPAGGASSGLQLSHHHHLSSSSNNHPSGIPNINRSVINKENTDGTYQKTTGLKDNSLLSTTKHHPYGEFGLVYSDSLLNPLDRSSSLVNSKNYNTSDNMDDPKNKSHNPLRQFMDDRTQLSISITSDFMPSASSPTNEKITASPPWLSRELEMGLGVGPVDTERNQSLHTNWIPISWGPSMGGPLGEVLHTTSNTTMDECRNTKPLNLIDAWDNSPRMVSSPTGVLQRGAFGSLSNSSAGSSPRAEICNGLMGLGFMNNPSSPAL